MKNSSILIASILIFLTAIPFVAKADSDIDLDDRVLYIETDEHDDYVVLVPEGSRLAVYIMQMDADFFENGYDVFSLQYPPNDFLYPVEVFDMYRDEADDDRIYRRRFEDFDSIVISTGDGEDGVFVWDEFESMPMKRIIIDAGNGSDVVTGLSHQFWVYGGEGSDRLEIDSSYASFIYGEDAADIVSASTEEYMFVSGGEGNDHIACHTSTGNVQIHGDNGHDIIWGGFGDDVLNGGDGDDYINGLAGNDRIKGGNGYDELFGSEGNDLLEGGYDGALDILDGGDGFDTGIKYVRYVSRRFANKNLLQTLEQDNYENIEIVKGVQK